MNFISDDSKLKPKVIISFLKERMWSLQMFLLDSLLELPLTSPFFVPAQPVPTWPALALWPWQVLDWATPPLLFVHSQQYDLGFLPSSSVWLSAPLGPHGNHTGPCPILSEGFTEKYPEMLSEIMKMAAGKWNWINSALIWAFQIRWALPIRLILVIGAILPVLEMGGKNPSLDLFSLQQPSSFFPSALTGCAVSLFLPFVWQCYCMHFRGEICIVTFDICFGGFSLSQSTYNRLKFRSALFFLSQSLNT